VESDWDGGELWEETRLHPRRTPRSFLERRGVAFKSNVVDQGWKHGNQEGGGHMPEGRCGYVLRKGDMVNPENTRKWGGEAAP